MGVVQVLLLGALGGLIPELLRIVKSQGDEIPVFLKQPFFYISLVINVVLGAIAAWLTVTGSDKGALIGAVTAGYSAPSALTKLLGERSTPQANATDNVLPNPAPHAVAAARNVVPAAAPAPPSTVTSVMRWWGR